MKKSLKLITFPFLLAFCAPSCSLSWYEEPTPFPNLVIYQGATRFSFGSKPEVFLESFFDEDGCEIPIGKIYDSFYSDRGFLLFIGEIESQKDQYLLFKHSFSDGKNELITEVFTNTQFPSPRFFSMANSFSPYFFVKNAEGDLVYAFIDKDEKIFKLEKGLFPFWAGEEGYGFTNNRYSRDGIHTFRYYDGTDVLIPGSLYRFSSYNNALFYRGYEGGLFVYEREKGTTTNLGDYTPLDGDRQVPLEIESTRQLVGDWYPFWYRIDLSSRTFFLLDLRNEKIGEEAVFQLDENVMGDYSAKGLGQSSRIRIDAYGRSFLLDINEQSLMEMKPIFSTFSKIYYGRTEYPIFEDQNFRLIENLDMDSPGYSSLYVYDKKTEAKTLVQKNKTPLFFYQRIEVKT